MFPTTAGEARIDLVLKGTGGPPAAVKETFVPVAPATAFADEAEVVRVANSTGETMTSPSTRDRQAGFRSPV
ncbi:MULTISPECIES: hypothetical protein [unclassified Knoellia]|uniref:hypothetical protein n=1 Tax=Knoellia altitudinis TaxID=3404795 RepID=UPI00362118F7